MVTKFADRYIELLTNNDHNARMALFDELVADIATHISQLHKQLRVLRAYLDVCPQNPIFYILSLCSILNSRL